MNESNEHVRYITSKAVDGVNDPHFSVAEAASAGRSALSPLPGFSKGDALASAVLLASAPKRMAVYDRRANAALKSLGMPVSSSPGRYSRYMTTVEALRVAINKQTGQNWLARDVDLALFELGR